MLATLAGCPGGGAGLGEVCDHHGDCDSTLQCLGRVCVPRCQRAPECGDGYRCEPSGLCQVATGQYGDACESEVDCAAGLACGLESGTAETEPLTARCVSENAGRPAGAACEADNDCRNGTCALGRCVDLCRETRDCAAGTSCTRMPRVEAAGAMFAGCLQSRGALRWKIPIKSPSETVALPIPESARSVAVTFSVEDPNQKVGAVRVTEPGGAHVVGGEGQTYYTAPVRHRPELAQSVLAMPSSPDRPLQPGAYTMIVRSLRPGGQLGELPGTATPSATAVIKLDAGVILDLHFHFLNFDDHPCADAFSGGPLDAERAETATFFQNDYLFELRRVFSKNGIALGATTYHDLRNRPDLDGLDLPSAPALLSLGRHEVGINVFFARTLSPIGLQAIGPNPGPAGLAHTRQSGVVIGLDTLCYRSWGQLARLTAHALARYMGLYNNVEIDPTLVDPIVDNDMASENLMFYSELGGDYLSPEQQSILARSPVLR
jgi:hypothetical protein